MTEVLRDVTVVIPTLGRAILVQCLESILAGTALPGRLIVVDQSSSPEVGRWLEAVAAAGVATEHVASTQTGRAAGLNRGLERVTSRFVLVTDDDCLVEPEWLANMAAHLEATPGTVVTGRVEAAGENVIIVVTSRQPMVYRRLGLRPEAISIFSGGNMGAALAIVERVGLFDEGSFVRTAEDRDWAYRVLRAGIPILYAPDAGVHHCDWRSEGERMAQYRSYARSHGGFYGKYLRQGDLYIAAQAVIHHGRALRRWLRGIATGDAELARNGQAYLTGLLPGIVAGLQGDRQP